MKIEDYGKWTIVHNGSIEISVPGHISFLHDKKLVGMWWLDNGYTTHSWIMENGCIIWHGGPEHFGTRRGFRPKAIGF